ncbi:MAG: S8 family serine peptidase [Bradyrhizobium sp.]
MAEEKLVAPYVEWAIATNFAFLKGEWFRVLLELKKPASIFAAQLDDLSLEKLVLVPPIYRNPSREFRKEDATFCMAIMTPEALRALVARQGRREVVDALEPVRASLLRIELGTPAPATFSTAPIPVIGQELASSVPRRAIVAVIDDGLAFAHERFRSADRKKTRFKYFWNQDDPAINATTGLGWGREFTEDEIDDLLSRHKHGDYVDEDAIYLEAGQHLAGRRATHGTHVMDVACGLDADEVAENSPHLIGVQLPRWVTQDSSGELLTPVAHAAIAYILDRADKIALAYGTGALPLVINLSYGTIAGPHDGSGVLEAAIDQWIANREAAAPLRVVFPAGNHYLARCHGHFKLPHASPGHHPSKELRWRVQPDDKAASITEIWLPKRLHDGTRPKLAISVTTPTGDTSGWIPPGGDWLWPSTDPNEVLFQLNYYDQAGDRPWIKLVMAPTARFEPIRTAPSGTWRIEIRNDCSEVLVDAWVQRGDTPFGYPLWGRQSRFDDEEYVRFDLAGRLEEDDIAASWIRRRGTQNALATGKHAVVIGGFRHADRKASRYSGAGPVATPRRGPDAVAIADDSVAMHGILAAGTRSGSAIALNGTSVAAPQVARWISTWMTKGLRSDRVAVQYFAANHDPNAPAPGSPRELRLGRGRIDGPEPNHQRRKRW